MRRWLGGGTCPEEGPAQACGDTGLAEQVKAPDRLTASRWKPGDWWNFLALGRRPEPLPSFSGLVEPAEEGKIGIACSGGGIRSASFNLGALQALQEKGLLKKSRYLSAVSGGSYIAAAFCMVRKTWTPGQAQPPGTDDSDPNVVTDRYPPFFPGSPEQQYLLNRSSYLAPDGKGKAAFGFRLLLGLGFNMLVVALFIALLGILLASLYGVLYPNLDQTISHCESAGHPCDFSIWPPPSPLWISIAGVGVVGIVLGVAGMLAFRWSGGWRDFAATWSLRLVVLAVVAAVLLIALPLLLEWFRDLGNATVNHLGQAESNNGPVAEAAKKKPGLVSAVIGAGGVTSVLGALFLQLRADWVDAQKVAKEAKAAAKWYSGLSQRLRRGIAYLIAALVGPALLLAFALVVMSTTLNIKDPRWVWAYFGGLAIAFGIFYATADLTTWSLHPLYRRRLASAFALKRVARPADMAPIAAEEAGIAVERDYNRLVKLSTTAIDRDAEGNCLWPTLLVCAAANVSDTAATPAGRAVSSFTFSPTSIGGPLVGAVNTAELEQSCDGHRLASFTLPAAVAISGAAISPSMGKMTRRPLRLLMGLANIRLGVWVPNPRRLETFKGRNAVYPRPRPYYLLRELLGLNQLNLPFLYVTDGGHYENLGAMELLRRGCTEVYCFDASKDELDAVGDMISLARSELGVEVEITLDDLRPNDKGISEKECVEGTILYPDGTKGRIFYARPAITEDAVADVAVYHRQDKRFPRDPTGDQLYTGQRFEAYRALGLSAGRSAIKAAEQEPQSVPVAGASQRSDGQVANAAQTAR